MENRETQGDERLSRSSPMDFRGPDTYTRKRAWAKNYGVLALTASEGKQSPRCNKVTVNMGLWRDIKIGRLRKGNKYRAGSGVAKSQ